MPDSERLLELIGQGIVEHGGDLGGWTRLDGDRLQLFDGRVTLRAEVHEQGELGNGTAHSHVYATLHEYDDELLDACVFGMGDDQEAAISEAAMLWIMCVAGPIKSFIDDQPACQTCRAGAEEADPSEGDSRGDYGLPGLRAFVGPSLSRGLEDERILPALDDTKPWFRYAAESSAPRRVHIAKATILSKGKQGWHRELEIDGHEVSHHDPNWPAGVRGPEFGYVTRFAVFEFSEDSEELSKRAELERTIRYFAEHLPAHESVDRLMEDMIDQGFDPDLVHESESISTIAFGRILFEDHGVQYSPTIIRARRNGRVEPNVPLMSIPAYSRARALAAQLRETMSQDDFQTICLYNAESNAICQALEAEGDDAELDGMTLFPCVVPDRGVSDETMDKALNVLQNMVNHSRREDNLRGSDRQQGRRPWWKFW
jgi:hypothetical protein